MGMRNRNVRGLIALMLAATCVGCSTAKNPGTNYISLGEVPERHYPDGTTCRTTRAPVLATAPDAGIICGNSRDQCCKSDADCTSGANGRCIDILGYTSCNYDQCFASSDCADGMTCACGDSVLAANVCVPSNCRTDSDCGANGYCSPTSDLMCGFSYGGAYCHTANDACLNDSDCMSASGGSGAAICGYVLEQRHWACVGAGCAG